MKKIVGGILGLLAAILVCIYVVVTIYFGSHFYPGTTINGEDFSNADRIAAAVRLMMQMQDYRIQVTGRDVNTYESSELFEISAEDVDLAIDAHELQGHVMMDESKLKALLEQQEVFWEENVIKPVDAYLEGYSEAEKSFVLVPEIRGTQADLDAVQERIRQAMTERQARVCGTSRHRCG